MTAGSRWVRTRVAVAAASTLTVVSACSTVVDGNGAGSPAPTGSGSFSSDTRTDRPAPCSSDSSAAPACTPSPTATTTEPSPTRYSRTVASTALGDPASADLCRAIGLPSAGSSGFTPRVDAVQYFGSCLIRYAKAGSTQHVTLNVYATTEGPAATAGRTTTTVSGVTVYKFPFATSGLNCERDVALRGVTAKITTFAVGASTSASVECGLVDQAVLKVISASRSGALPRLPVPSPSLTGIDACKVSVAAKLPAQPFLAGAKIEPDQFGAGCTLTTKRIVMYLDPAHAATGVPPSSVPSRVGNRTFYAATGNGDYSCSFTSVQRAGGTFVEYMTGAAYPYGTSSFSDPKCMQTRAILARYLDTAQLR